MVEWIEIVPVEWLGEMFIVSTLVVEWIEIVPVEGLGEMFIVSTLVVEWIEIPKPVAPEICPPRLHPRGGVD